MFEFQLESKLYIFTKMRLQGQSACLNKKIRVLTEDTECKKEEEEHADAAGNESSDLFSERRFARKTAFLTSFIAKTTSESAERDGKHQDWKTKGNDDALEEAHGEFGAIIVCLGSKADGEGFPVAVGSVEGDGDDRATNGLFRFVAAVVEGVSNVAVAIDGEPGGVVDELVSRVRSGSNIIVRVESESDRTNLLRLVGGLRNETNAPGASGAGVLIEAQDATQLIRFHQRSTALSRSVCNVHSQHQEQQSPQIASGRLSHPA